MRMTKSTLSCSRQGVTEMEDLQQQLAQARMVISHLASQLDHHKDVQNQLAGLSLCSCLLNPVTSMGSIICHHDGVCHVFTHLRLVSDPYEASLCTSVGNCWYSVWCQTLMLAMSMQTFFLQCASLCCTARSKNKNHSVKQNTLAARILPESVKLCTRH